MQDLFQQIYIENLAVQGIVEKPSMNQMQLLSSKSSQPVGGCTEKNKETNTAQADKMNDTSQTIDSDNICKNKITFIMA